MMRRETFSSSGEAYYRHVESGFDDLAASYDTDIAGNEITIRMREIFRRALLDSFHPGERLVEIGCGTGIDAVWLAEQGLEVVATDISQGMVDRVAEKARAMSLKSLISRKMAAKDSVLSRRCPKHGAGVAPSSRAAPAASPRKFPVCLQCD